MVVETVDTAPLTDFQNWYRITQDPSMLGKYILTDPLNGERLHFDVIPSWLKQEQEFQPGLEFLQKRNVHVVATYGPHEHDGDLGSLDKGSFERRVATTDYYGFESYAHTEQEIKDFQTVAHAALKKTVDPENFADYYVNYLKTWDALCKMRQMRHRITPHDSFWARVGRAVAISGTPCFSYDIRRDSPIVSESTILNLKQRLFTSFSDIDIPNEGVAFAALINAREWIMAARVGQQLHEREGDAIAKDLTVAISAGYAHRDLSRKLRLLAAEVTHELIRSPWEARMPEFPAQFRLGVISAQQANVLEFKLFGMRRATSIPRQQVKTASEHPQEIIRISRNLKP